MSKPMYKEQPLFDPAPYEVADAKFHSKSPVNVEELSAQNKQIYEYLLGGKTITSLRAMKKFGVIRLASRIFELKKIFKDRGTGQTVYDRFIDEGGTRVKEYSLTQFLYATR